MIDRRSFLGAAAAVPAAAALFGSGSNSHNLPVVQFDLADEPRYKTDITNAKELLAGVPWVDATSADSLLIPGLNCFPEHPMKQRMVKVWVNQPVLKNIELANVDEPEMMSGEMLLVSEMYFRLYDLSDHSKGGEIQKFQNIGLIVTENTQIQILPSVPRLFHRQTIPNE